MNEPTITLTPEQQLVFWTALNEPVVLTEAQKRLGALMRGEIAPEKNPPRIAGSNDSVITGPIGAKRVLDMDRVLSNLKQKLIIEGAGHWIQQERPDEVNAALIGFLKENAVAA